MLDLHSTEGLPEGVELRHIEGYPNYLVGEDGSVWSCIVRGSHSNTKGPWWRRKGTIDHHGYLVAALSHQGKVRLFKVHTLVLNAFVGPRPDKMECRHLDGDTTNAHLNNLKWGTRQENADDVERHGHRSRGETHGRHRLQEAQALEALRLLSEGWVHSRVASEFGVHPATTSSLAGGHSWIHLSHFNLPTRKARLAKLAAKSG